METSHNCDTELSDSATPPPTPDPTPTPTPDEEPDDTPNDWDDNDRDDDDSYLIRASAQSGGNISTSGSVTVDRGESKTFTITPDAGYAVAKVLVDGNSVGAVETWTFENIRSKHTIQAVFAAAETPVSNLPDGLNHTDHIAYVSGYADGLIRPNAPITRAQVMTIINRALNRGVSENSRLLNAKNYPDNPETAWHYYEVLEAANGHDYTGTRPNEHWTALH